MLTRAQLEFMHIVTELATLLDRSPSIREVARELDCNNGRVHALKQRCIERGWLENGPKIVVLRMPPPLPEYGIELTPAGRAYCEARP